MPSAIALEITEQAVEDPDIKVSLNVLYYDSTLGIKEFRPVYVKFLPTATVQQIENAFESAIISQASSYYPTMVLTVSDIIMIDIKRGN